MQCHWHWSHRSRFILISLFLRFWDTRKLKAFFRAFNIWKLWNYGGSRSSDIFFPPSWRCVSSRNKTKVWNSEQLKKLLYFFFTRGYLANRKLYRDKWTSLEVKAVQFFFFPIIDRIFNRVSKVNFVAIDTFICEKRSLYNNILNIDQWILIEYRDRFY